jgi:hypothetical protein
MIVLRTRPSSLTLEDECARWATMGQSSMQCRSLGQMVGEANGQGGQVEGIFSHKSPNIWRGIKQKIPRMGVVAPLPWHSSATASMCRVCRGGRRYLAAIFASDSMGSRFGSILDKVVTIKHKTTSKLSHRTIILIFWNFLISRYLEKTSCNLHI